MDPKIREHMVRWEGEIPHMYLDTRGKVTVGIGHLLADVKAAQALGFVYREDQKETDKNGVVRVVAKKGDKASAQAIATDFATVQKKAAGLVASLYKGSTRLELPDGELEKILAEDVREKEEGLLKSLPEYRTYPPSAQLALLDMAFNLGVAGLNKFVKLQEAVKKRDWETAAKQCHRKGPSEERNKETERLFRAAVGEDEARRRLEELMKGFNSLLRPRHWTFPLPLLRLDTSNSTPALIRPRVQRGK